MIDLPIRGPREPTIAKGCDSPAEQKVFPGMGLRENRYG
jgi:hypothetical protein